MATWSRLQARLASPRTQGALAVLLSALVSGLPPIFGKQAILAGTAPLTVVMLRTVLAGAILWAAYGLFGRRYLYIYPLGLAGCLVAGLFNGLGSVMFYAGLGRIDASLAQLLFMLYTLFLTLLARLDGYPISRFTLGRLGMALAAVTLLAGLGEHQADALGVALVVAAGLLYALHVAVNQRVLVDVPAPTVAVYTMTAMAVTVSVAYALGGRPPLPAGPAAWQFVTLLTVVTVLSRLGLFTGVKYLGGLQTALLGLSEALVTLLAALLVLGETLTASQWLGAGMLGLSLLLATREGAPGAAPPPRRWLQVLAGWTTPPTPRPRPAPPPANDPADRV